mmetsp:Transcript_34349/g.80399  ORF Transcript_34349/g.80399 Transcript_34349/m.80399 type:complete len:205 (+) Transcript_34349:124-738(+)
MDSSSKTFSQQLIMLATPRSRPSSWLPGTQGLLWSIEMPAGTGKVFAKSMRKTPASGPCWSTTNKREDPIIEWPCTRGDTIKVSRKSFRLSKISSATPFCSCILLESSTAEPSSATGSGKKNLMMHCAMSCTFWSCFRSVLEGGCGTPAMPSTRKPKLDKVVSLSLNVIQRYLVIACARCSSGVGAEGSNSTILLYRSGLCFSL